MKPESLPRVSVLTVVRNGELTLGKTIASVLAQDYPALEYRIIDGASTDGTLEIIRRHAERLAGWTSEPDQGIADGFNKGIAQATGDYLMFLNADDHLAHPRAISELAAHALAHGLPQVVYGDSDLYDPDTGDLMYRVVINYDRARFLKGATIPHPSMLMHRRYFERFGKFDPTYKIAMDFELFLRGVPSVGAERAPVLVTNVEHGGISARSRDLVVEETIRALNQHGHLSRAGELAMRARYAARGLARKGAETLGLYPTLREMRRKKHPPSPKS